MSNDNENIEANCNNTDEQYSTNCNTWEYPDLASGIPQNQNRTCCSPVDEIELLENEDENSNATHSVKIQTDKPTSLSLKHHNRNDNGLKKVAISTNNKDFLDKRNYFSNMSSLKESNSNFENVQLKKTFNYENDKISAKLTVKMNSPEVLDDLNETDLDQPMDYTLCYNETNLNEEKKDFICSEETVGEVKVETIKAKTAISKEPTKNKKEMFSNTSRSFKEIFNFFKDRDKKKSAIDNSKTLALERTKVLKTPEPPEKIDDKVPQNTQQSTEQCDKDIKSKNEAHCSQMLSRCSSLGSLNGLEQNSLHDDQSSIVSDFSRRTSGVVSPSELPDLPAQITPAGNKSQQKSQTNGLGRKRIQLLQQERLKNFATDNPCPQTESNCKKSLAMKRSVFEDNVTSFKDESTPTKLHSMATSSLSSLTIDDDDDYELLSKIIVNKEKSSITEETHSENDKLKTPEESKILVSSSERLEKIETLSQQDENFSEEENDELTDFTSYEEQLLDEYIRRGIAKWTKKNINDIEPFSWDIGLTCRATRTMLASKVRVNSNFYLQNTMQNQNSHLKNSENNIDDKQSDPKYLNSNKDINLEQKDQINENSYYITYEEHLLDECIRRGMAKITKRNIADFKPFSWDANQICLTTRAMMFHGQDENIYINH